MIKPATTTLIHRLTAASRRPAGIGGVVPGAISLAMGEPDVNTSPRVVETAIASLRAGRTRYAPLTGAPDLRSRLAEHVQARHGRTTTASDVVLTHGGSAALLATVLATVGVGDRVLIPEPTYSLYADHVAMAGAETVWIPNRADGSLDLDALSAQAADAAMLVICNPSNPSGHVLSDTEIDTLAKLVRAHANLLLLVDEAYSDIVFDDRPFRSALTLEGIQDRVIVVGTFSKSYAMTGWRLGYAVTSGPSAQINLIHRTINGALNTMVQDAGLAALATPVDELREQATKYQRRRDLVVAALRSIPGVHVESPSGAFYAFPRIDSPLDSPTLAQRFQDGGVLVRAGSEYGPSGDGHVRISFATDEQSLTEALRRFASVVEMVRR